ncbi:MAG: nitrilase-related carbon-nitrogen hydrolase, partial [Oscillospiraceae bacterium]
CLTGYTCGDLFFQKVLLDGAEKALLEIAECTKSLEIVAIIGVPVRMGQALFNSAAVISCGKILGIVPKKIIPNYSEFCEERYFAKGTPCGALKIGGNDVFFGTDCIFCCENNSDLKIGIEFSEEISAAISPSCRLAENGATLICNLAADFECVGAADYKRFLIKSQSAKLHCGYIFANAGSGESTTDLAFSGHNIVAENGVILAESERFSDGLLVTEIDLERLCNERRRHSDFTKTDKIFEIEFPLEIGEFSMRRKFQKNPFIPSKKSVLDERCVEILSIQTEGLAKRLSHIGCKTAILGLSGGLDSTLALIVAI